MANDPVVGQSTDPDTAGVLGEGGTGVYGRNTLGKGNGVIGYSGEGRGVWGHSTTGHGVLGESVDGRGVAGSSGTSYGIRGHSRTAAGIRGTSDEWRGVEGEARGAGDGVLGTSSSGYGIHGIGGKRAGYFEGNVEVTGELSVTIDVKITGGLDCAEEFNVSEAAPVEPGTVMVLGEEEILLPSHQAYDKRVAGVISGAGNYKPGIVLGTLESKQHRLPVALLGKVFCKVDAQFGAIAVGDLLTTSSTLGHAMRADDPMKAFGAVIGKALRPLKEGQGLIPILIALQ